MTNIKGYFTKEGRWVSAHTDKRPEKKVEPPKQLKIGHIVPASSKVPSQHSLPFDTAKVVSGPSSKPKASTPWKSVESLQAKPKKPYDYPPLFGEEEYHHGYHSDWLSGWKAPEKPKLPEAIPHPKKDEHGKPVQIDWPSKASGKDAWTNPEGVATWTPGGEVPAELNGIPMTPWIDHPRTHEDWNEVEGQMDDLDEPMFEAPKGKKVGSGVVIEEEDGRVWILHPTNRFAGYKASFPKGGVDDDMYSMQGSAIKEVFEETGLKVQITGFLMDQDRSLSRVRYYTGKRVGGSPAGMGWEAQAVSLVPKEKLYEALNRSIDHEIAEAIGAGPKPLKAKQSGAEAEDMDGWQQVGHQGGSNPGGLYKDADGKKWYVKFPQSTSHAKNELLASKLYGLAGIETPELKLVNDEGHIGIASAFAEGLKTNKDAIQEGAAGAREGFGADAWLANWDSVGLLYDNMLLDQDGKAVRIDPGGSLIYRAQGGPKGAAFGNKVTEIDSLRDPKVNAQAASVFGGMTDADLKTSVAPVLAISKDAIRQAVMEYGPGGKSEREALADKLIARQRDLARRFEE